MMEINCPGKPMTKEECHECVSIISQQKKFINNKNYKLTDIYTNRMFLIILTCNAIILIFSVGLITHNFVPYFCTIPLFINLISIMVSLIKTNKITKSMTNKPDREYIIRIDENGISFSYDNETFSFKWCKLFMIRKFKYSIAVFLDSGDPICITDDCFHDMKKGLEEYNKLDLLVE